MIPPDIQVMNKAQVMVAVGAGTIATFDRWRREGKLPGFPDPISPKHWDPVAIRAWMNTRMPERLRARAGIIDQPANDPGADPTLAARARAIAGEP